MTRHILLLCLLGNPFELNLGGHQRTVLEIIEHFKDMPRLEITVITTTKSSLKQLTPNHLYSNIVLYEISIKKEWFENQDLLYDNRNFLYETVKKIYENIKHPITEYSCAMKSHFRKFGNQMSGSGNHLCNYASLLA